MTERLDEAVGIHAVEALLTTEPERVKKVLFCESRSDQRLAAVQALAKRQGVAVQILEKKGFDRKFASHRHQGVVAECRPAALLLEIQMLEMLRTLEHPCLVLVLDGVTDPHNLGAVLRTADAAGVDCVITPSVDSVGITSVVRKVASGAADTVPICRVKNLARTLNELKQLGLWLYGAADQADTSYTSADYTGSVALLLGAEGSGLRRLTREACDVLISIPMAGAVSSLNVSVATGVCLFEVVRQRR